MNLKPNTLSKTIRIDVLPRLTDSSDPLLDRLGSAGGGTPTAPSPIRPEDFLRFFENAYDAALITDQDGLYVTANQRVSDLLAYSKTDLQGIQFWQLISGANATLVDTVRDSLASERFLRISAWCIRKEGTLFPAEIAVNQFHSEGRVFFCFFIRDETLRTQAEAQLRTVQNATKNASTGIAVAEMDGSLLYANAALASLFGAPDPEKLVGQTLANLLGDDFLNHQLIEAVQNDRRALVESALRQPDGGTRWVQISAAPNLDSEDTLIGMVLSLVDISDRKRAEQAERVVERDKVMMDSFGTVCHHLGQPATVLLSSLEMLSRIKDPHDPMRDELFQMSLGAAESLRKMLKELNDLRHYNPEPYPGPSATRADHIVSVQLPDDSSPESVCIP